MSFLRTCRQIYGEARQLLYSTNTFSFDSAHVLNGFISALVQKHHGLRNHLAIRSLHLRIAEDNWRHTDWALCYINRLKGLRHIGLSIEYAGLWGLNLYHPHTPAQYGVEMKERKTRTLVDWKGTIQARVVVQRPEFQKIAS